MKDCLAQIVKRRGRCILQGCRTAPGKGYEQGHVSTHHAWEDLLRATITIECSKAGRHTATFRVFLHAAAWHRMAFHSITDAPHLCHPLVAHWFLLCPLQTTGVSCVWTANKCRRQSSVGAVRLHQQRSAVHVPTVTVHDLSVRLCMYPLWLFGA